MRKHPRRLEAGALTVGLWLLAIATASAAPTGGYLPATGAAPLRFQPPSPAGLPAGLPPLLRRDNRSTNVNSLAANPAVPTAANATNRSNLPLPNTGPAPVAASPPDTAASPVIGPLMGTAASPAPALPPDTSWLAIPPLDGAAVARNPGVDRPSVLSWLVPASTNAPVVGIFPVFVPAMPPPSSHAVYESR
jgi:hypothetical protein